MKRTIITTAVAGLALVSLTGCGGAAPTTSNGSGSSESPNGGSAGSATELTIWNWGDADEAAAAYTDDVKAAFAEMHPDVTVKIVNQPFDQYYTLLGSAIEAGTGPDLALYNGGTQIKSRASSLVPITDEIADLKDQLAGWPAFEEGGETYSAPTFLQGFPIYYNKALFEEAGLDADQPPQTWDELSSACQAILDKTDASCFALGNKEGLGIEFFLSGFGSGIFTPEEYDAWIDGERDWTSEHATQVLQMWADSSADGWYNDGANSTAMFNDSFDLFSAGDAAMVIGLMSGTAHWKQFDDFLGDDLGFMMPPTTNDGTTIALPAEGGIGYGILNEGKKDLGVDWIRATVDHDALAAYSLAGGQITSDTTITLDTDIASANEIVAELPGSKPLLHTALGADELDLLHRLGQQLLNGDVTVDDATAQLAAAKG
ncbi:sugar ABC transporter substrate-binding protein [Microbacterium sorbitolivorans]|uniref:Extracellular solute-binding protein n=1 Tax=Microbacterium sorbitolivorans TaxID=1867410 RepID=A0A367XXI4_9MICO|nr:extracellular solute-binding protein [Microbacterium sorbitolivorans]RCK58345.1 extracellular solute-binding protein [Microbacterium sorbitolivorans]GGF35739.1 sugar ABC transporter substrate-binding protein [Microbacterium sorbitolivorans]